MKKFILFFLTIFFAAGTGLAEEIADELVRGAFDHMRGNTSSATMEMIIHRPDFTRTMVIEGWTKGDDLGLFHIISPAKDRGNATLKKGQNMWTFNPKINRVIKLPPSMMSQGWMGSDFSNNDLARTDSIINDYDHTITSKETAGDLTVYEIESIPRPGAPVVWGKLKLTVRSDHIMLEQVFYDQDNIAVKTLETENIQKMGGRLFPKTWTMKRNEEKEKYTSVEYRELEFDIPLKPGLFTITSLKNPVR